MEHPKYKLEGSRFESYWDYLQFFFRVCQCYSLNDVIFYFQFSTGSFCPSLRILKKLVSSIQLNLVVFSFPIRLTAFVAKSFAQARAFIPEYIDDELLEESLEWMSRQTNIDKSFRKVGKVHSSVLKVMCFVNRQSGQNR